MRRPEVGASFLRQSLAVAFAVLAVSIAVSGCGGEGGSDYPGVPTVTTITSASTTLHNGGPATFTATVASGEARENVQVDFFLKPSGVKKDCTVPASLPSWHALLPEIGQGGGDAPPVEKWQQRFVSTEVSYDPGTGNRRAQVARSLLVPEGLSDGSYYVVSAVAGSSGCTFSRDVVTVSQPTAPNLLHATTRLNNNSFSLRKPNLRQGKRRAGPDFQVSSEIANTGLDLTSPLEVGFDLEVGGHTYPLLVEVLDGDGLPTKASRYVYNPKNHASGDLSLEHGGIRGATFRVYLGNEARAVLEGLTADTDCRLRITIDPDGKVQDMDRSDNLTVLPVGYLAGSPSCTPSDPKTPDVVFCLGPQDSWMSGSWTAAGFLYAGYQLAGSSADPAYFAYNQVDGVPTDAHFHSASWVQVGMTPSEYVSPVNALIDLQYTCPPVPVPGHSGELQFAEYQAEFEILGDKIIDMQGQVTIESEKDFEFFDKEKKWVLYKDTVDCEGIPVTFEMGIEGDIALKGSADLDVDQDQNAKLNVSIGPEASLSAFGQAQVDLIIMEAGVGVELTIIDVDVSFQPYLQYYSPPQGTTQGAVQIGANLPLDLGEGAGDFYVFLKSFGHKWKTPIVSWDGWSQDYELIPSLMFFLGPLGEFFTTLNNGDDGPPSGAVYSNNPPTNNGVAQWEGDIKLDSGPYQFSMQNVSSVKIKSETGTTWLFTSTGSCGDKSANVVWNIPSGGNYTLQVNTDTSCYQAASTAGAYVTWAAEGDSSVGGLSGKAGTLDGSPTCAVSAWYYNTKPASAASPAMYQCVTGASLQNPFDKAISSEPAVNAPEAGVWVTWKGQTPFDLSQYAAKILFNGNPPVSQSGCASPILDEVSVSIASAEGQTVLPQTTVSIGKAGTAMVSVPKTGDAGPYFFTVNYHPAYQGDYSCTLAQPNDANIQMTIYADGNWFIEDTCVLSGSYASQTSFVQGPGDPTQGTLDDGSVDQFPCSDVNGKQYAFALEAVYGAFDFGQADADYDLFVGSSTDQSYRLWIDGTLVASRIVQDPTDSTQNPSAACCQKSGNACPTRESTSVYHLSPGYHFIEGYFTANNGNYPQMQSENRIRWSPRNPNESLVSLYGSQAELDDVLFPPDGTSTTYNVEPLLIMKDTSTGGLSLDWTSSDDCDFDIAYASCDYSLQEAVCNTGDPSGMGFSALWDGFYSLTDQQLYSFSIQTNRLNADFWLDGQQYSRILSAQKQAYNAFPLDDFYSVLLNNATPNSNGGLNHLQLAMGGAAQGQSSSQMAFQSSWSTLAENAYQVQFLDQNGNQISTATDNFGAGETQTFCIGAGCPAVTSIPSNACRIVVFASPIGDPQGTYNGGSTANQTIDQVTQIAGPCTSGVLNADLCINGQCQLANNACVAGGVKIDSPSFVAYANDPTDTTQNQGLFSQAVNAVVVTLRGSGSGASSAPPYSDCLSPALLESGKLTVTLSYQQHTW